MKLSLCFKLLFLSSFFTFGQGQIQFNSLKYNLSPVSVGKTTYLKIPFINIGNKPMIITRCQSSNGTSVISASEKPILPNQSDTLTVKILNNSIGNFRHTFVVGIDNQEKFKVIEVNINVLGTIIFGKVTDKKTGEPIPGATVTIDKTNYGSQTDFDGNYSIIAKTNDTLVFSFVGMKTQKIKADKEIINVQLLESETLKENVGPPIHPKIKRLETTSIVTKKDIENAANAKYNFKKNAKNNVYVIYVSELTSYNFNLKDLEFQQKYNVKYSLIGSYKIDYLTKYNKLTFKHLKKKYKKTWLSEIRKDAVGLEKE